MQPDDLREAVAKIKMW